MKALFIILFSSLVFVTTFAQGTYTDAQRKKDKAKLDSICRKSPSTCLYYGDVMGINSIFRKHEPKKIDHSNKICFNKKFHYKSNINGKMTSGCFYINTNTGYVAMFMSNLDNSCTGMDNPKPGFDMMIISKIGESFIFRVSKKGKKTFMAQMPPDDIQFGGPTNFLLKNPNALQLTYRELFTSENLPTLPYKIEGSSSSSFRYLFGGYHAQRIPLKDYIGAFGLGYYKDGMNNTFICSATENKDYFVKVEKIENINECFDGSAFGDAIQEGLLDNETAIKKKEKNLENQENSNDSKNCAATTALVQHKKQMLAKEKSLNDFVKSGGNANSKEGQKLLAQANDVINQVISHRLETEKKICSEEYSLQMYDKQNNQKLKANTIKKINCYQIAVSQYEVLQEELEKIDTKFGNKYMQALSEKNMVYLKRMKDIDDNCNQDKQGNIKQNPMDAGAEKLGKEIQKMMKRN